MGIVVWSFEFGVWGLELIVKITNTLFSSAFFY